jgi:hypothetical protein
MKQGVLRGSYATSEFLEKRQKRRSQEDHRAGSANRIRSSNSELETSMIRRIILSPHFGKIFVGQRIAGTLRIPEDGHHLPRIPDLH